MKELQCLWNFLHVITFFWTQYFLSHSFPFSRFCSKSILIWDSFYIFLYILDFYFSFRWNGEENIFPDIPYFIICCSVLLFGWFFIWQIIWKIFATRMRFVNNCLLRILKNCFCYKNILITPKHSKNLV